MQSDEIRFEAIPDVEVDPKRELEKLINFAKSEAIKSFKEEGFAEGLAEGRAEGKVLGIAEGMTQGREETQREVILNSYEKQLPLDTIAEICGVSIGKVKSIINKYCNSIN